MTSAPIAPPAAAAARRLDIPAFAFWAFLIIIVLDYLGLGQEFAALRLLRVSTLLAYGTFLVVSLNGGFAPAVTSRQGKLLISLAGLAFLSLLYGVVRSYAAPVLRSEIDYLVLFVLAAALVDRRSRVSALAVVATLVLIVLALRNIDLLTSGVRLGVFRSNVFMGDGNDFAWGLIALAPFPLYLMLGGSGHMLRLVGLAGVATALFAVVGTQSRGATLGIVAAGLYYFVVLSRRRSATLIVTGVLAAFAVAVAPESYFSRITETDVSSDSSAQGRIRAWRAATNMALDFPFGVGVGSFNSAYGRYYMEGPDDSFASRRWISAHSIYFKTLGESGFPGVALLLALMISIFRENQRSRRYALEHPDRTAIDPRWPAALNFGFTGYAVAGAFLGGLNYPHIYLFAGLAVATRRMTSDLALEPATAPVQVPPVSPVLVGRRPAARAIASPHRGPAAPLPPRPPAASLVAPRRLPPAAARTARAPR